MQYAAHTEKDEAQGTEKRHDIEITMSDNSHQCGSLEKSNTKSIEEGRKHGAQQSEKGMGVNQRHNETRSK